MNLQSVRLFRAKSFGYKQEQATTAPSKSTRPRHTPIRTDRHRQAQTHTDKHKQTPTSRSRHRQACTGTEGRLQTQARTNFQARLAQRGNDGDITTTMTTTTTACILSTAFVRPAPSDYLQPLAGPRQGSQVAGQMTEQSDGPSSIDGLFAQPAMLVARVLKQDALRRCLLGNLAGGLALSTAWSGMMTPELGLEVIVGLIADELGCLPSELKGKGVSFVASCDVSLVCMDLALNFHASNAKMKDHHVFLNVLDQLPPFARQWLIENGYAEKPETVKKVARKATTKAEYKAARLVQCREMQIYMLKNCKKIFQEDTLVDCARHKRQCPSCTYRHEPEEPLISAEIVGTSCQEDSPLGSHLGEAGDNILSASVWAAKVRSTQPVFFIHECHKNFAPKFFETMLEDMYEIFTIDGMDPSAHGWPVRRRGRRYTWGVRRDWILCGGAEDFKREHSFKVCCSGKTLFAAPQKEVEKEFKKVLRARKFSEKIPMDSAGPWEAFYSPSMRDRLSAAHQHFMDKGASDAVTSSSEMNADLDQNVGVGPAPGILVPTLVTHGRIYNTHLGRHATALEHLVMQGVPVYDNLQMRMGLQKLPWGDYLATLPDSSIKMLAGNAMFLPSVIYQQLYLLCRLRTRSSVQQPEKTLAWSSDLDTEDFNDDV